MKSWLIALVTLVAPLIAVPPAQAIDPVPRGGEYIVVCGGVSLWQWEKWKAAPHDNWWANFVRASRIRINEIQSMDPNANITWFVYRPAYISRTRQDANDLISHINSVRDTFGVRLVWFDKASELINYLNSRGNGSIVGFEYFGHSNKACFMFDYSCVIDSASKVWLHEDELKRIRRGLFRRDAFVKSWGCHTGESMSKKWYSATGVRMWGAVGKTQYNTHELPHISTLGGHWVR